MNISTNTHLNADTKLKVYDHGGPSETFSTPIISFQADGYPCATVFFESTKQLSALREAITDYLANRFAMAPEVEAVA